MQEKLNFLMSAKSQNLDNFCEHNKKSLPDLSQKHIKYVSKSKWVLLVPSSFLLCLVFIHHSAPEPGKKSSQAAFTVQVTLSSFPSFPFPVFALPPPPLLEDLLSGALWPLTSSINYFKTP